MMITSNDDLKFLFKYYCRQKEFESAEKLILELSNISPKRICFSSTHQHALKLEENPGKWIGHFSIPFKETIYDIFQEMTGLELFKSKYGDGYWRSIRDIKEYNKIKKWIEEVKNIVFLRNCLDLSIALSENFNSEDKRTKIGELEYEAKYRGDMEAAPQITNILIAHINLLPFFKDVDYICAVPPSKDKGFDLPSNLSKEISKYFNKVDITP